MVEYGTERAFVLRGG